jgi:hypothetical protein
VFSGASLHNDPSRSCPDHGYTFVDAAELVKLSGGLEALLLHGQGS